MKKKTIKSALKNELIIVSGIPRSGTSLLMQMLRAGGVEILSDHKRKADKSNPKGYLEMDAVKRLEKDNSCLKGKKGKAVKVISHLLKHVPEDQEYKVIFMNRKIKEILKSQDKMVGEKKDTFSKVLIEAFKKELKVVKQWARENPRMEVLNLHYGDMIKDPQTQAEKIIEFLNAPLDKEKMVNVVDPSLYRSKVKE